MGFNLEQGIQSDQVEQDWDFMGFGRSSLKKDGRLTMWWVYDYNLGF